jgi:replicative DNA helicase
MNKELPHAELSEKAIIGAMLTDEVTFSEYGYEVDPEHFYSEDLKIALQFMQEHKTSDLNVLSDRFKGMGSKFAECMEVAALGSSLKASIATVADKHQKREIWRVAQELIAKSLESDSRANDIVNDAVNMLSGLSRDERRISHISECFPEVLAQIKATLDEKRVIGTIKTGITDLDAVCGEFMPGDLIIVAGRPSMGKSSLAARMVRDCAVVQRAPVLLFTLEMDKILTTMRILAGESGESIRYPTRSGFEKMVEVSDRLGKAPIYLDDTPAINLGAVISRSKRVKSQHGLGLIVIDHMQLMGTGRGRSRNEEVSEISSGLKNLARSMRVPIVCLSQLSRSVDSRTVPIPMLSDLRDSGAIEQDADKVFFLYREEYYKKDSPRKGIADIIVAKNRNGETGTVEVSFIAKTMSFENLPKDYQRPDDSVDQW